MAEPTINLNESKQPTLTIIAILATAVSCIALILRLVARKISNAGWWWDDGFAVVAWAFVMVSNATGLWATREGLGLHEARLGPQLPKPLHALYFDQVWVHPCLASSKLTILLFYARIFSAPNFRRALWVVALSTIAWLCGTLPAVVLQCHPIRKAWLGPTIEGGHCINLKAFFIGQAVPNTLLDIALICLPLAFLWRLQMTKSSKLALSAVFCIGIFETIVSIVRLVQFVQLRSFDETYRFWNLDLWSRLETNVGLLCACLMATGPLVKLVTGNLKGWTARTMESPGDGASYASRTRRPWANPRVRSRHHDEFERLPSTGLHGRGSFEHLTEASGTTAQGKSLDPEHDVGAIRLDEIHVTRDVNVTAAAKR